MTESRNGAILTSIINATPYTEEPQSRIEELLIELKVAIESSGGGSITSYNSLTNKPMLNGTVLAGGQNDLSALGIASKDSLEQTDENVTENARAIKSLTNEYITLDAALGDTVTRYQILNNQNIEITHKSEDRAKYNSYLILTQMGIVYIKVVGGVGTAVNLAGYSYDVTCTVSGMTVNINLGYAWNVGVIIPVLNDYVNGVTFS